MPCAREIYTKVIKAGPENHGSPPRPPLRAGRLVGRPNGLLIPLRERIISGYLKHSKESA